MSQFPHIDNLVAFKAAVGEKDEIRHMPQANGMTVSCYIVSMDSTFDNPHAAECRGLVFDQAGAVAARPLHKFFNLNERVGSRPEDFNWNHLVRIMDKRDGSMIHTVKVPPQESPFSDPIFNREGAPVDQDIMSWGYSFNTFILKSKKSFTSDVAVQAQRWMSTRPNYIEFCQQITDLDCTVIFEWTSPTARIVLPYAEELLTVLHIRDNKSGEYVTIDRLLDVTKRFEIPVVDSNTVTSDQRVLFEQLINEMIGDGNPELDPKKVFAAVQKLQETMMNVEGWVFQFKDGQMVKVKTKWYLERHRAMTFLRERDVVLMVLRESIDDLKALLVGEGVDVTELRSIEDRTVMSIQALEHRLRYLYEQAKSMTKKEAALKFGPAGEKQPLFSMLMSKMDGREPDVKGWYERNVLPTIPLRQLNMLQSIAEAE